MPTALRHNSQMRTIDDYMDTARKNHGFRSDRELSRALGFRGQAASNWRTKRAWPSDDVMVRLAEMAEIPPEEALLDLCVWRTGGTEAGPIYSKIADKVRAAAIAAIAGAGFLALASQPNSALAKNGPWTTGYPAAWSVYYGKYVAAGVNEVFPHCRQVGTRLGTSA